LRHYDIFECLDTREILDVLLGSQSRKHGFVIASPGVRARIDQHFLTNGTQQPCLLPPTNPKGSKICGDIPLH
jgi:hypothetical protein